VDFGRDGKRCRDGGVGKWHGMLRKEEEEEEDGEEDGVDLRFG